MITPSNQHRPRILHANVFTHLPAGVRNQLKAEYAAVQALALPWEIAAWSCDTPNQPFMRAFPTGCNSVHARRLYFLRWLNTVQAQYDIILLRHPLADPFLWLHARKLKMRVSVHHTKEIEECPAQRQGLLGWLATTVERTLGTAAIRSADAILAVTDEIAQYEMLRSGRQKPYLVTPNGIETDQLPLCDDQRGQTPRLLFVASHFADWHGLDLLLDSMAAAPHVECIVDLIGELAPADRQRILHTPSLDSRIVCHGKQSAAYIANLAHGADMGLSSFAMHRNAMQEACTLKVREYLAMGLPVYAGHRDAGLPEDYPFYHNGPCSISHIVEMAEAWRQTRRSDVRESARQWIEKSDLTLRTYQWLATLPVSR